MARVSQAEIRYVKTLRKVFEKAQSIIISAINPLLALIPSDREDATDEEIRAINKILGTNDATVRMIAESLGLEIPTPTSLTTLSIKQQFDFAERIIAEWLKNLPLDDMLETIAKSVDNTAMRKLGKELAINIRKEVPGLNALIEEWSEANVGLIKSNINGTELGSSRRMSALSRLRRTVDNAHAQGMRVGELAKLLREEFGMSKYKADLVARDQTLKLNGAITKHRQTNVGITEYKWVSSRDERVRPTHVDNNGKVFNWAVPPEKTGHPGEDIQCRCTAKPILPNWLEVE